jgi:transcriptional antiterminator RfaH
MAEAKALAHLAQQRFEAYAPRIRERVVRRGRLVNVERFLFPRYLFVRIGTAWRSVLGTIGVASLLRHGDKPALLPAGWVERMRAAEQRGYIVLPSRPRFGIGERVRITAGPLRGWSGIYEGMSAAARERVLLDSLGRVELASADLR